MKLTYLNNDLFEIIDYEGRRKKFTLLGYSLSDTRYQVVGFIRSTSLTTNETFFFDAALIDNQSKVEGICFTL